MPITPPVNRRTVVRAAVWATPAIAMAAQAPQIAASQACADGNWRAASDYYPNTPDAANSNIHTIENASSTPPGWFEIQHWGSGATTSWRLTIIVEGGAEAGAVIVIPVDPSWTLRTAPSYGGQRVFGTVPDGITTTTNAAGQVIAPAALPSATISATSTEITITFPTSIPVGGGGTFGFSTTATASSPDYTWTSPDGTQTVQTYALSAEATMTFTPQLC